MDDIADALGWEAKSRNYSAFTFEDWLDLARPFNSRVAFTEGDSGACQAARSRGLIDDIADALGWVKGKKKPKADA